MYNKLENYNFHDVIFILRKHLFLIIAASVLCTLIGLLVSSFFITPKYQAEAKLIVNTSTLSNNDAAQVYNAVQLSQKEVDTYAIIMKNNTILNKVIKDLNLGITKEMLAKKINIQSIGTTEVIDLKVIDENPGMAKDIATDIIKLAPAEIIRTVKAGSVEVVSLPETTNSPISPNIFGNTAISFIIGITLSILSAFLLEMFNNTFTNEDDVEKYFGYSVVGVIPNISIKKRR